MVKIAITTTSFGRQDYQPLELLRKNGFRVKLNPYGRKLKKQEIAGFCKDVSGIIAGTEQLDADTLKGLKHLRVISRCGAGLDNIDLRGAKNLGIKVYNTAEAPAPAVAELTVGLILNLVRKVNQMDRAIRNNKWDKLTGNLICGKKIGIIGFGRIGKQVARLLKGFGCELRYFDPFLPDKVLGIKRVSLKKLLTWADIISIHASTHKKLIGKNEIAVMKKGAWLLNLSRGDVVDEAALYRTLKLGRLSGAALDVFEREPYRGRLKNLDNVILTPHIGSYAKESRVEMEMQAAINILKGLKDKKESTK